MYREEVCDDLQDLNLNAGQSRQCKTFKNVPPGAPYLTPNGRLGPAVLASVKGEVEEPNE